MAGTTTNDEGAPPSRDELIKSVIAGGLFFGGFVGLLIFMALIGTQSPTSESEKVDCLLLTSPDGQTFCLTLEQESILQAALVVQFNMYDDVIEEVLDPAQESNATAAILLEENLTRDEIVERGQQLQIFLDCISTSDGDRQDWDLSQFRKILQYFNSAQEQLKLRTIIDRLDSLLTALSCTTP